MSAEFARILPQVIKQNIKDKKEIEEQKRVSSQAEKIANVGLNQNNKQVKKVGRNDPCPCGSGKKYKKCHGANL